MYKYDFVEPSLKVEKAGNSYRPSFVKPRPRSEDIMFRGGRFYAAWDEERGLWTDDQGRVAEIIDDFMDGYVREEIGDHEAKIHHMCSINSHVWDDWNRFVRSLADGNDSYSTLDDTVTFADQTRPRGDHVSKKLPYRLEKGEPSSYLELMQTLYDPEELTKLEWGVGCILCGEGMKIQKFFVLYGDSGKGKSTALEIIDSLLSGYTVAFNAKDLAVRRSNFVLESFRSNPLAAIEHDGDLSKIWDNTLLNQIVSHEPIIINEKFKQTYRARLSTILFIGTNRLVEITEARSGIIRRLIDVRPTGNLVPEQRYFQLMDQIKTFELGMIARRCMDTYMRMGPHAYSSYKPVAMIAGTNRLYNFIFDWRDKFLQKDAIGREEMWGWYKQWCDESGEEAMKRIDFGNEMMAYYDRYDEVVKETGYYRDRRKLYRGFKRELFDFGAVKDDGTYEPAEMARLELLDTESQLDSYLADHKAQYWDDSKDPPLKAWRYVHTTLSDLDTHKLHGVLLDENHIVIDFDIKNVDGEKDRDLNLAEAAKWPDTYAEYSKSGAGVHLHYLYAGDPKLLANSYSKDVEIKRCVTSPLRRQLSYCRNLPIATLSDGVLPKKGEKRKVIDIEGFKNEKKLRSQIQSALQRKVHPNTRPSIDFISKLLDEAWASGEFYDVTDLRPKVLAFANNSTNQSVYCLRKVSEMHFCCKSAEEQPEEAPLMDVPKGGKPIVPDEELCFFDVEVFQNVFIICHKMHGSQEIVRMINPTAEEVRALYDKNLVGFNNRNYDNHLLWAAGMLSYSPQQLYSISKRIIDKDPSFKRFPQAYGISYTDVYDFASSPNKMGLKKWEIKLGLTHIENHYDWDQPLPEEHWDEVCDYCCNDVVATEAVFDHIHADYTARCILATMADSVPNQSTRNLLKKIIFKGDPNPRSKLVYTDLSEMFPGYKYEFGKSTYRGYDVGEGGFVFAVPGMYKNVKTFDVASMHPASCIALNYLGPYTKTYAEFREARIAIKHGDENRARGLLDGVLGPFLDDPDIDTGNLSNALKTALNSLYGYTKMTSALDFVHPKNKDNIIAKRGALFMINLLEEVKARGGEVVHIKTDSIKVVDPSPELEEFIFSYGKEYGYEFEVESVYDRFCLVNDAVYIAYEGDHWTAIGAQFAEPFVFKTLFSHEPIEFDDLCVTKSVSKGKMYIDMYKGDDPNGHDYQFVGTVGKFCPVKELTMYSGPLLVLRDDKYNAVSGTKGYSWKESERLNGRESEVDVSYFLDLQDKARNKISEFGDFDKFEKGEL